MATGAGDGETSVGPRTTTPAPFDLSFQHEYATRTIRNQRRAEAQAWERTFGECTHRPATLHSKQQREVERILASSSSST